MKWLFSQRDLGASLLLTKRLVSVLLEAQVFLGEFYWDLLKQTIRLEQKEKSFHINPDNLGIFGN